MHGNQAHKFVFPEFENNNRSVILFSNTSTPNSWFLSIHAANIDAKSITRPLLLQATDPTKFQLLLSSLRTNYLWSRKNDPAVLKEFFGYVMTRSILHFVPKPKGTFAYKKYPSKTVTAISLQATALYGIGIVLAIVLFPTKEILSLFLVDHKKVPKAQLFVNDFDEFSANFTIR